MPAKPWKRQPYSLEEVESFVYDGASSEDIAVPVREAIEENNKHEKEERRKALLARKLVMPNSQLTVRIEVHLGGEVQPYLLDVANSIVTDLDVVVCQ